MLTFEDCLALCNLSEEEISAIAEHEHMPEIAALELGEHLIKTHDGENCIKCMIIDDIERSKACGNIKHANLLESVLRQYLLNHPESQELKSSQAHL